MNHAVKQILSGAVKVIFLFFMIIDITIVILKDLLVH